MTKIKFGRSHSCFDKAAICRRAFSLEENGFLGLPRTITSTLMASMKGKRFAVSNVRVKTGLGWQQQISLEQSLGDTMKELGSEAKAV